MDFEGIGLFEMLFGVIAVVVITGTCSGAAVEIVKTLHEPPCECAAEASP